jgi:hypothetical protein
MIYLTAILDLYSLIVYILIPYYENEFTPGPNVCPE